MLVDWYYFKYRLGEASDADGFLCPVRRYDMNEFHIIMIMIVTSRYDDDSSTIT
jgi:hypothetical protein